MEIYGLHLRWIWRHQIPPVDSRREKTPAMPSLAALGWIWIERRLPGPTNWSVSCFKVKYYSTVFASCRGQRAVFVVRSEVSASGTVTREAVDLVRLQSAGHVWIVIYEIFFVVTTSSDLHDILLAGFVFWPAYRHTPVSSIVTKWGSRISRENGLT